MSATRHAVTVWRAHRARSPTFASPATDVTDILEVGRVSPTISRGRQRENSFVSVKDVARHVDCSRRMPDTNVTRYLALTVSRIGTRVNCAI